MSTSSNSSCCLSLDHQQHQQQLHHQFTATPTPPPPSSLFPPSPSPSPPPPPPPHHHHHHGSQPPPPPPPSAAEQLCYVHCGLCDTVLAVSVPCSSLFKTVTVRCGHCTNLLPVNMRALLLPSTANQLNFAHNLFMTSSPPPPPPPPPHNLLDEIPNLGHHHQNFPLNTMAPSTTCFAGSGRGGHINNDMIPIRNSPPVTSRPPEKRQRVPSAYNRFIKDEIQRIKAGNPDISHREAFSAAAKNWAHFPHIHFGLMPDQTVKKSTIRPQEGEDVMMKDGFFAASANVGVSPY
ncbi:hypothetical protein Dimus_034923 [Dionaea muscipula]